MKKLSLIIALILPIVGMGQSNIKPVKPNINKAENALKAGKLLDAKTIIDATTASSDYLVDKNGYPTKNAARSWFVKGLVYLALDSTKDESLHSLVPNSYEIAAEAFEKSKAIDQGKSASFITGPDGLVPVLNSQIFGQFGQLYFNKAITEYQDNKDYPKAFDFIKRVAYFIPNDTSVLLNAGVYFGPAAEEYDESLKFIGRYITNGGNSQDAYIQLFSIYRDKLKDNDKALEVVKKARQKFPLNSEFPKYELDMYIKMKRLPDAKVELEKQLASNPNDKEGYYYLGVINAELGDRNAAVECYKKSIDIDEKYFEPRLALADAISQESRDVKNQMNQLGITAEDRKKRFELDKVYVEKLKASLPYWQICEKLSPDDSKVLDVLLSIYSDLGDQNQVDRLTKRMKALGLFD